ncbi:hypothetical protein ROS1_59320 [Roseibium sp. ROS1]
MPSSARVKRAPWGQAPLELESNYAQIKKLVDSSTSLRSAFARISEAGLVTVKYDAFAKAWRKLAERKATDTAPSGASKEKVGTQPKRRKALPAITGFKMPTGSDEVDKAW